MITINTLITSTTYVYGRLRGLDDTSLVLLLLFLLVLVVLVLVFVLVLVLVLVLAYD